jgi:hypothetical protein
MSAYHTTAECYVDVEFSFGVDPGYKGSRIEPPEAPAVENLRATIVGPRGERLECPDWLIDFMVGANQDWLLTEANEQRGQAIADAADARRDVA